MNILRIQRKLYDGPELGFIKTGIEMVTNAGSFYFKSSDLLMFKKLELEIGSRNYEIVINAIKAKIKIPGIYSAENGYSLSYLKLNNSLFIIAHEEIQPNAYIVLLEGIIFDEIEPNS